MKQKKYFNFLLISLIFFIFGCSNPNIISDQNSIGLKDVSTDFPSRADVIKNEENVVSDRSLLVTGKDLYVNSKFMRSVIPASRFANITRGRDVSNDIDFKNDNAIDSIVQKLYEKATEEEKQYLIENIDNISFKFDIVTEVNDTTNDKEKAILEQQKQLNQVEDEIYNNLGVTELAIESTGTRSNSEINYNLKKYRVLNKHNRYRSTNEVIVKAYDLAIYFLMSGEIEEVENINKMLKTNIDMGKLKALNIKRNETTRSGVPNSSFKQEQAGALDWVKANAKNGDIVSRGMETLRCIYGIYDHSSLFNRKRFDDGQKRKEGKWARCMLASYPTGSQPSSPERSTERVEYASYEPLANFIDTSKTVVNRYKYWYYGYGDAALMEAEKHFYGNGNKSDYDKWCQGWYWNGSGHYAYNCISEYLNITDASYRSREVVNYCSFIAWYGYNKKGIELDSDAYFRESGGNMIVPDDLVDSCLNYDKYIWVAIKQNGACGEWTKWEYQNIRVFDATTTIVY